MTIAIDNPPVNVLDVALMSEISRLLLAVRDDPDTRVLVFQSANPAFFIAHVDMTLIDEPHAFDELASNAPEGLNPFQAFGELLRSQPQVTLVKLAGLARGGGAEFVAAADMAFAARETAGLAQCEALMGITPGGGATQYLMSRMTRGRALEVILGADLIDAATAERYGWINRALPAAELDDFVDRLARNIAALPAGGDCGGQAGDACTGSAGRFLSRARRLGGIVRTPGRGAVDSRRAEGRCANPGGGAQP